MRRLLSDAGRSLAAVVRREPVLVATGCLGIVLAAAIAVVIAVRGPVVPPEGFLKKPLTFDLAIGIYVLTLAVLAPLAGFTRRRGNAWRVGVVATTLYGYAVETIQTLRGLDPRFSRFDNAVDAIAGALFGLGALLIIVFFMFFAIPVLRRGTHTERPLLVLGVRYGVAAVVLGGFSTGFWMGINQGRFVGETGSILAIHALGLHGLQAIPIVAWLLERSGVPLERARWRIHVAGIVWLLAIAAVAIQTALGQTVVRPAPATIAALACLVVWAGVAVRALAASFYSTPSTAPDRAS